MKKEYQKPTLDVYEFMMDRAVLQVDSPIPTPGGGGDPDAPEFQDFLIE